MFRHTPRDTAIVLGLFPGYVIPAAANNDLQEQLFSNRKPYYETTANMSGGGDATQYYVSAAHRQEPGLALNTGARLQSIRANIDQAWSSRFKTSVNLNITRNTANRGISNNDNTGTSPIYMLGYTPSVLPLNTRDPVSGVFYRNPVKGGGVSVSNPFENYTYLQMTEDVFRQTGSVNQSFFAVQSPKHNVTLTLLGGFDRFQQSGTVVSPSFLQYEGNDNFFGRTVALNNESLNYNAQFNTTWVYNVSDKLSLTTSGGAEYASQKVNSYSQRSRGILPGTELTGQGTIDNSASLSRYKDQSIFANEQILALNNKLTVNAGIRGDRSSANANVRKFYFFPRASASYNLDGLGPVDNLKFRAGYGETGNRPTFGFRDITLSAGPILGGQATAISNLTVGNPLVKPETLREYEGGIDATLFGQRVQLEGTYYSRQITDLLLQPAVAPTVGVNFITVNGGKLRSEGFEGAITVVPINTQNMQWTTRATFQKGKQRVLDLPDNVPAFAVASSGYGSAYGRGFIREGELTTLIWGNAYVDPVTGAQVPMGCKLTNQCPTAVSREVVVGDANPDFQMGFNNSITFKRLTLSFTWDWRKGGDIASLTQSVFDEGGNSRDYTTPLTAENLPDRKSVV